MFHGNFDAMLRGLPAMYARDGFWGYPVPKRPPYPPNSVTLILVQCVTSDRVALDAMCHWFDMTLVQCVTSGNVAIHHSIRVYSGVEFERR